MSTTIEKLKALSACREGITYVESCANLREAWDLCGDLSLMQWLMRSAHVEGTLTRRRLVLVSLQCLETCVHLMPAAALPHLAELQAWAAGDDSVDLAATRDGLYSVRQAAAYAAYDAAYAAAAYAAAYAYDAGAYDAGAYAAAAADPTTGYAAARFAMCDVLRAAITIDEVAAALGLDPDEATNE